MDDQEPAVKCWGRRTGISLLAPVTVFGRFVAALMMVVGFAAVSAVTASVAAWFVSHVNRQAPPGEG